MKIEERLYVCVYIYIHRYLDRKAIEYPFRNGDIHFNRKVMCSWNSYRRESTKVREVITTALVPQKRKVVYIYRYTPQHLDANMLVGHYLLLSLRFLDTCVFMYIYIHICMYSDIMHIGISCKCHGSKTVCIIYIHICICIYIYI